MKSGLNLNDVRYQRQSPPPRLERLKAYHIARPSPTSSDASFVPLTPVLTGGDHSSGNSSGNHGYFYYQSQPPIPSPNVRSSYSMDDMICSSSGIIINSRRLSSASNQSERMKSPSSGESHQLFRIPVTVGSTRQEMIFYGDHGGGRNRGLSARTCTQSSTEALTDITHTPIVPSPVITSWNDHRRRRETRKTSEGGKKMNDPSVNLLMDYPTGVHACKQHRDSTIMTFGVNHTQHHSSPSNQDTANNMDDTAASMLNDNNQNHNDLEKGFLSSAIPTKVRVSSSALDENRTAIRNHHDHGSNYSLFELMVSCIVALIGCIIVILLKVSGLISTKNVLYMLLIVVFVSALLCLFLVLCKAKKQHQRESQTVSEKSISEKMNEAGRSFTHSTRVTNGSISLQPHWTDEKVDNKLDVVDTPGQIESEREQTETPGRPDVLLGQCNMDRIKQTDSIAQSRDEKTTKSKPSPIKPLLKFDFDDDNQTQIQGETNGNDSDEEIVYNQNGLVLTKREIQSYLDHRRRRKRRRQKSSMNSKPCPVGRWYKGDCIGCGTFGKVFMALSHDTGEVFVVKQVPLIKDSKGHRVYKQELQTIHTELETLSSLQHPNIVKYYGSSVTQNHFNIFLEYMPGGSLTKLVKSLDSPLDIGLLRSWMAQILDALAFLHSKEIVHRDVKGSNILLDSKGNVKLADFGAAKDLQVCTASSIQGTAHFMAPEVVRQKDYDTSADIWSLGITCIELCNGGKPPFYRRDPISVIHLIGRIADWVDDGHNNHVDSSSSNIATSNKSKNPLVLIDEAIPKRIGKDGSNFIRRCLKGNPSDRPTAEYLLYEHPFLTAEIEEATDVCSEQKDEVIEVVSGNLEYENQVRKEMLKLKEERYQRHRQRQKILRESQIKARELKKEQNQIKQSSDHQQDSPESATTIPLTKEN